MAVGCLGFLPCTARVCLRDIIFHLALLQIMKFYIISDLAVRNVVQWLGGCSTLMNFFNFVHFPEAKMSVARTALRHRTVILRVTAVHALISLLFRSSWLTPSVLCLFYSLPFTVISCNFSSLRRVARPSSTLSVATRRKWAHCRVRSLVLHLFI